MGDKIAAEKPDFSLHITPKVLPNRPSSVSWAAKTESFPVREESLKNQEEAKDATSAAMPQRLALNPFRRQKLGELSIAAWIVK